MNVYSTSPCPSPSTGSGQAYKGGEKRMEIVNKLEHIFNRFFVNHG